MKVFVDATKCSGYGACAELAPNLFELDEWGYAAVIGDGVPSDEAAARRAAAACPELAITIEE
ncbi:ferredoxin [Thermomonospora echinospora]|uniref:Ferredoxin n=1 Tax=Thermomonospora echinospora TaxID=1992 RepID=A0A1H6DTX6_9ACTN|nr:ferredoxin [Thermomonospora echinospora]SEG88807.1 ferredoxin [Thermomonospora echinospora]